MVRKNWLVRMNLCQDNSEKFGLSKRSSVRLFCGKLDCENEVLSRLFWESKIMKMKFCQFDLWLLYCAGVVLSGKLFRIKTCLRLYSIFVSLLCKSETSQLVYSLRRWRFYLLPLSTSGCRIKSEQCSFLCRRGRATLGWGHSSSQHARIL